MCAFQFKNNNKKRQEPNATTQNMGDGSAALTKNQNHKRKRGGLLRIWCFAVYFRFLIVFRKELQTKNQFSRLAEKNRKINLRARPRSCSHSEETGKVRPTTPKEYSCNRDVKQRTAAAQSQRHLQLKYGRVHFWCSDLDLPSLAPRFSPPHHAHMHTCSTQQPAMEYEEEEDEIEDEDEEEEEEEAKRKKNKIQKRMKKKYAEIVVKKNIFRANERHEKKVVVKRKTTTMTTIRTSNC